MNAGRRRSTSSTSWPALLSLLVSSLPTHSDEELHLANQQNAPEVDDCVPCWSSERHRISPP
ncbi:hypothetical protein KIN20_020992 [Parelaphostrongylus tenuis]|uniref:Secreted protein n=1 Tax=Parelaphostrongylus tenuis TaxID=148309 RepID=A0AAD5N3T3_PARTN|nr:hypothetical protein KIN20_020992 [Parelaphostrongylus tenuis]